MVQRRAFPSTKIEIAATAADRLPPGNERRTATVVIVDGEGGPLGALPPVPVATSWWQDIAPVVAAVRDHHGVDITVLRLLETERAEPHGGLVTYLAEGDAGAIPLTPWPGRLTAHPQRSPYAAPGGPAADVAWAIGVLSATGQQPVAPPQQMRTWNLSSLWSIPLADQVAWLKVVPGFFAHEGAVITALAGQGSGAPVPVLIGHDGARMLLSEIPGPDHFGAIGPVLLMAMIDVLVGIQVPWLGRADTLLGLGMPNWRAQPLTVAIADVVARTGAEISPDDRTILAGFVHRLPARFAALDQCGFGDTIVHGDFHSGNLRGPNGRLILLDWGDSGLGHPLLDEAAFLAGVPAALAGAVRRHWHDRWRAALPGCDPPRAADLIAPIAAARQAVVYQRFLDNIEPSERIYHRTDPADWLQRTAALVHGSRDL